MTAAPSDSHTDGWLVWEVPGKPVSVRLTQDVVGRLGMSVREGFKALPRRGLETGGLLIGTRRDTGSQVVVDITDFEPIESEHAAGPSYLLSNIDRRLLETRISARGNSIVGFYRSHTRRNFAITMEDASLFSTYFRKSSDVFLLIKSHDDGPPTGGFIIREEGKILSDTPYAEFPLRPLIHIPAHRDLPIVQTTAPEASIPAWPAPHAAPQPARIESEPAKDRFSWMARRPVWLAIAGAIVLALVLSFAVQRRAPVPNPAEAAHRIGLSVTNTGNGLRVSWDHRVSSRADHATLVIKDGPDEQRFELDSSQLSSGSVTYWPRNTDVNFRLELPFPGAAESVRAIGGPSGVPVVPPGSITGAAEALPLPSRSAPVTENSDAVPAATAPPPQRTPVGTASRQIRAFASPTQPPPGSLTPAALPDAPPIQPRIAPPLEQNSALHNPSPPMPPPSHESAASVRVTVEPVPGSRMEHFARNIPLLGKRYRRPDYVPPAPLPNQPLPDAPRRTLARDLDIPVRVYVDASGKVEFSEVVSDAAERHSDLAALAVFSARRWQFVPARTKEGVVPGQVILHYQFRAGAAVSATPVTSSR